MSILARMEASARILALVKLSYFVAATLFAHPSQKACGFMRIGRARIKYPGIGLPGKAIGGRGHEHRDLVFG